MAILIETDTAPTINGVITDDVTGAPLDLAMCTVYFQLRRRIDRRFRVNGECAIDDDPSTGAVSYELNAEDLDFAGDCYARFLVVFPDLRRQHTTPAIEVTVEAQ